MKNLLFFYLLSISVNAISQDFTCMDIKLYSSNNDVVEIRGFKLNDLISYKTKSSSLGLELVVFTDSLVKFPKVNFNGKKNSYIGYKAILTNSSLNETSLSNMDGKIKVVRQVYHKNRWVDIQSFNKRPRRICGNSYMSTRIIKPESSLVFLVPCLNGEIKTTFRVAIYQKSENAVIYSNEFEGFVSRELLE